MREAELDNDIVFIAQNLGDFIGDPSVVGKRQAIYQYTGVMPKFTG